MDHGGQGQGGQAHRGGPRFTRSASQADLFVRLGLGSDSALFNGLSYYMMENNRFHRDYVANYTNAGFMVKPGCGLREGLFAGSDKEKRAYNPETWDYETDAPGNPVVEHPRCVVRLMKAEFSRYTPERVAEITGMPRGRDQCPTG